MTDTRNTTVEQREITPVPMDRDAMLEIMKDAIMEHLPSFGFLSSDPTGIIRAKPTALDCATAALDASGLMERIAELEERLKFIHRYLQHPTHTGITREEAIDACNLDLEGGDDNG